MKSTYRTAIKTLLASLLGFVLLPVAAQATCSISGPIVRVLQYDDSYSSRACYIYMRSGNSLSSVYYYTRTNDDNMCSTAATAVTSSVDVYVRGDATSCPTADTARFMGELQYFIINN